jgi:hypothetical protein
VVSGTDLREKSGADTLVLKIKSPDTIHGIGAFCCLDIVWKLASYYFLYITALNGYMIE